MENREFWESVNSIIESDFTIEGIDKLERYAELFSTGKFLFKRFSPQEQYGCTTGGSIHVIASIIAGAEAPTDPQDEKLSDLN